MKKQIIRDVEKLKKQIISKVSKIGIYENLGEKEQRKLRDKYDVDYDREIRPVFMAFVDWCQNYDGQGE